MSRGGKKTLMPGANGAMLGHNTGPFPPFSEPHSMSRVRAAEPYIQQKVNLPATLMARFNELHWDPVLQKPQYGSVSRILTDLLTDYVNRMEHQGKAIVAEASSEPKLDKL